MRNIKTFTLRQARLLKGLTMIEAAEKVGIHFQTLRNWELKKTQPNYSDLLKLLELYEMELSEIEI